MTVQRKVVYCRRANPKQMFGSGRAPIDRSGVDTVTPFGAAIERLELWTATHARLQTYDAPWVCRELADLDRRIRGAVLQLAYARKAGADVKVDDSALSATIDSIAAKLTCPLPEPVSPPGSLRMRDFHDRTHPQDPFLLEPEEGLT